MQILKISILFPFLFVFVTLASGQKPHFVRYDVEDGLPSNEVYHVIQDSKGYTWFATDQGVSRFDGYEFKNFDLMDGLPDNTIFEIYEDYKGRIWFVSFSLKLSYYYKGEIHAYPYNDKLTHGAYRNQIQNKLSFHVDKEENVYLGIRNLDVLKIDSKGNIEQLNQKDDRSFHIYEVDSRYLTSKSLENYESVTIHKRDTTIYIDTSIRRNTRQPMQNNDFAVDMDEYMVVSHGNNVYKIDNQSVAERKNFSENILWLSKGEDDLLWMGTRNGINLIATNDFKIVNQYLNDHMVTSCTRDNEGSYWFTTADRGVYFCPNLSFLTIDKSDGLISNRTSEITFDSSGGVWIGYAVPYLSHYKNGKISNIKIPSSGIDEIYDLDYDPFNDRVLISRHNGCYSYSGGRLAKIMSSVPQDIFIEKKDKIWLGFTAGIGKFNKGKVSYNSCQMDTFCLRVNSLFSDTGKVLYIGGLNGLWKYENGHYEHLGKYCSELFYRISEIKQLKKYLVVSTRGSGLLIYDTQKNNCFKITEEDGLISNAINTFEIDQSVIWASSNEGISKVIIRNNNFNNVDIVNLTTRKGLPYPELKDIAVNDSLVYVATQKGLSYFPKTQTKRNMVSPKVHIENITIHDEDTLVKNQYQLKHNENYITIQFVGLAYRNQGDVEYKYQLMGLDTSWKFTQRTSLTFTSLPPGDYQFVVMAKNEDGIWSENPARVDFHIKRPFWRSWWFIILVVVFVAALIYAIMSFRLRMIRKRNELIHDINEYKQKILRQQMNPHFIFNTLNSIQYFLLDEDTTSSLTYLTKFAKMMRIVLDNSQHTFVPIEDEIRGLDLYLELEALRFEESFDYKIYIDKNINTFECKIPALLLQPYVENSIRHGLLHKRGKGFLSISIELHENSLFCIIEDNGVGRKRSEEIKMSQGLLQKSLGSKITEDRIKVLNSLYSDEIDIKYVDLTDSEGNPTGTRVEIKLPFIY